MLPLQEAGTAGPSVVIVVVGLLASHLHVSRIVFRHHRVVPLERNLARALTLPFVVASHSGLPSVDLTVLRLALPGEPRVDRSRLPQMLISVHIYVFCI